MVRIQTRRSIHFTVLSFGLFKFKKKGTALALNPKGANFIESMVSNSDGHNLYDVVLIILNFFTKRLTVGFLVCVFKRFKHFVWLE